MLAKVPRRSDLISSSQREAWILSSGCCRFFGYQNKLRASSGETQRREGRLSQQRMGMFGAKKKESKDVDFRERLDRERAAREHLTERVLHGHLQTRLCVHLREAVRPCQLARDSR